MAFTCEYRSDLDVPEDDCDVPPSFVVVYMLDGAIPDGVVYACLEHLGEVIQYDLANGEGASTRTNIVSHIR